MVIKPDPAADDNLPQLRRPHSTAPENMPPTPHTNLPPHSHPDDRRHMSFDAAQQTASVYRQPSYPQPPPTPLTQPQPYDYPPSAYGPSQTEMSYAIPIAASGKRKAQRASQACDSCRQLKAKCDETKPCKSCREKKLECRYRDPAPKQQDKLSVDILESIQQLHSKLNKKLNDIEQRQRRLEHALRKSTPGLDLKTEPGEEDEDNPSGTLSNGSLAPVADDAYSSPGPPTTGRESVDAEPGPIDVLEARKVVARQIIDDEELETEPGRPVSPGNSSIPTNHTTVAAFLLKWTSIRVLVQHHLEAEQVRHIGEFPIRQEERRGLLRIFGRGEGHDNSRGDRDMAVEHGLTGSFDGYSDAGAPSPADCWGPIGGLTPTGTAGGKGPVLTSNLDFSEASVWRYVRSYEENIQNMHPLIVPHELHAMVKVFLDSAVQQGPRQASIAKFATPTETGAKRKRQSPGLNGSESTSPTPAAKPAFQRSAQNALVLLVLALGKVCLWKDRKIPEPIPVSDPLQSSPSVQNGYLVSPLQGSPPSNASCSHSSEFSSPKDNFNSSRRTSFQGVAPMGGRTGVSLKRNMDVIPGLDFFATATDILGGQMAGSTLRHIHANILAGLYHGQLGRVIESYAYIKHACYALQVKMRPSIDRLSSLKPSEIQNKTDNQLIITFWTCMQLESDIIAELALPQSNILAYEALMPYPNLDLAQRHGFGYRVMQSYQAQLYLRKMLNGIHRELYHPKKSGPQGAHYMEYIERSLVLTFVPPGFEFSLDDPPASDILSARLRAKYWGARVITYRPYVRMVLEFNANKQPVTDNDYTSDETHDILGGFFMGPGVKDEADIDPRVIQYAKEGIRALVESTRAFHGLEDRRFIVTNIFGTAHAQWGNLLTLSAVYRDPTLGQYVGEPLLRNLFTRTIQFFKIIAHSTSGLATDLRILQGLERDLWYGANGDGPDGGNGEGPDAMTHSSFSTISGGGPPVTPTVPVPPGMHAPGALADAALAPPLSRQSTT